MHRKATGVYVFLTLLALASATSAGCGDDDRLRSSNHSGLNGAPAGEAGPGYDDPASDAGIAQPAPPSPDPDDAAPPPPPDSSAPPPNTSPPDAAAPSPDASAPAPKACTFNGQTVAHGGSVVAYREWIVPADQGCTAETRTCNDGTLSGSFTNAACTVGANPSGYTCRNVYEDALIPDAFKVLVSWSSVPDLATCILLCQSRVTALYSGCNFFDATFADAARRNTCNLTDPFGALLGGQPGSWSSACF